MNEDTMNDFCSFLEDQGLIDYTEVWVKGNHPDLYGRTFTKPDNDGRGMRHRIEVYENSEHSNAEILCHELSHVMLYASGESQDHGPGFSRMEQVVTNMLNEWGDQR